MKLRAAFLIGLLVGTTFVVARRYGFDGLSNFNRAMRFATTWIERGQRLPRPTLSTPVRSSLARGGGTLEVKRVQARVKEELPLDVESPVIALAEHDGTLYLGTFDEGAFRLAPESEEPELLAVDLRVNDLAVDQDGTLWVATADGAWKAGQEAREAGATVSRVASGAYTAAAIWKGAPVFASRRGVTFVEDGGPRTVGPEHGLAADSPDALADCGEKLCVGATDGLWLFDGATATRHSSGSDELPTDWVTAAAFDGQLIWAGTFDGGLAALAAGTEAVGPASLPAAGTEAVGPASLPAAGTEAVGPASLPAAGTDTRATAGTEASATAGTEASATAGTEASATAGTEASTTRLPSRRFSPADGLPDGRVFPHAMTVVNGAVYVGTATGLVVLRGGKALRVDLPLPSPITAVAPAESGGIWVGYEGGAMRLSIDEGDDV